MAALFVCRVAFEFSEAPHDVVNGARRMCGRRCRHKAIGSLLFIAHTNKTIHQTLSSQLPSGGAAAAASASTGGVVIVAQRGRFPHARAAARCRGEPRRAPLVTQALAERLGWSEDTAACSPNASPGPGVMPRGGDGARRTPTRRLVCRGGAPGI